ncbi:MAG: glutamate-5-semialdehyde dehydrogenase [Desulfobacterales bacterium]|nr:glutamate-5-semialdehyde dehydrogenase [Desulfobacterales bacterium]
MNLETTIMDMAKAARAATREMARCPSERKNRVLLAIADLVEKEADRIKSENARDLEYARGQGLSDAMIDRLTISDDTIRSMADGLREVAGLSDPVGTADETILRPNGLEVSRVRIPLGVIGIIYESRPNVTIDAAGLCLKSGNVAILRGGSEALHSNQILATLIRRALGGAGLPEGAVQVVPVRDRSAVNILLEQEDFIDLIIPRGGEGLIRFVVAHSKIPVLKHYKGVCHVYVDADVDLDMAVEICCNAKIQRPGVCNAMETLLVHKDVAEAFLPVMAERFAAAGVEMRGCPQTGALLSGIKPAMETDWPTEFLDLIIAIKVVDHIDQAVEHIAAYSSNHTEAIVTNHYGRARQFVRDVDSSVVLVNASTRFNDGGQLGLGAEMGISTSKLHAFGPMGLKELTTTKFVVFGDGQVRT